MNGSEGDGPVRADEPGGLVCARCGMLALRLLAEPDIALCPRCEAGAAALIVSEDPPSEP